MVIFCEECGEKYILEPDKVKGAELIFICRICNDIISVPLQDTQGKRRVNAKGKRK
jgi:RNase P subunit RPR2